jgi:hypothetical protein
MSRLGRILFRNFTRPFQPTFFVQPFQYRSSARTFTIPRDVTLICESSQNEFKSVEALFLANLDALKLALLNKESPTIFIIYAHDNNDKQSLPADAKFAQFLIEWLRRLNLKVKSDRSWVKDSKDVDLSRYKSQKTNILSNQICILPDHKESVNFVILCGSQLMMQYYEAENDQSYIVILQQFCRHYEQRAR